MLIFELALNQVIHIHAFVSNLTKCKDGKFLKTMEAKLSDKTGVIKLTIFKGTSTDI